MFIKNTNSVRVTLDRKRLEIVIDFQCHYMNDIMKESFFAEKTKSENSLWFPLYRQILQHEKDIAPFSMLTFNC